MKKKLDTLMNEKGREITKLYLAHTDAERQRGLFEFFTLAYYMGYCEGKGVELWQDQKAGG